MVDINQIEYNDFDDESINKFNIQDLENEVYIYIYKYLIQK
jgi:hypothetical protein